MKKIILLFTTLALSTNMMSASAFDIYTEKLYGYENIGETSYCPGKEALNNIEQLTSSGWKINQFSSAPITDDTKVERLITSYTFGSIIADVTCKYSNAEKGIEIQRTFQEQQPPYPLATDIGGSNVDWQPFAPAAKNCTTTIGYIKSCGWLYLYRHLRTDLVHW